jgi:hypothetical protein
LIWKVHRSKEWQVILNALKYIESISPTSRTCSITSKPAEVAGDRRANLHLHGKETPK